MSDTRVLFLWPPTKQSIQKLKHKKQSYSDLSRSSTHERSGYKIIKEIHGFKKESWNCTIVRVNVGESLSVKLTHVSET